MSHSVPCHSDIMISAFLGNLELPLSACPALFEPITDCFLSSPWLPLGLPLIIYYCAASLQASFHLSCILSRLSFLQPCFCPADFHLRPTSALCLSQQADSYTLLKLVPAYQLNFPPISLLHLIGQTVYYFLHANATLLCCYSWLKSSSQF